MKYSSSSCGGTASGTSRVRPIGLTECSRECKADATCLEFHINTETEICTMYTGTCMESAVAEGDSQLQFIYKKEAADLFGCRKSSLWTDSWTTTGNLGTAIAEIVAGADATSTDCGPAITYPSADSSRCPPDAPACMAVDVDRGSEMFFYLKYTVITQNDEKIEDQNIQFFQIGADNQVCADPIGFSQSETVIGGPASRLDPGRITIALPLLTNSPANKCNYKSMVLTDLSPNAADAVTYPAVFGSPPECLGSQPCPFVDFRRNFPGTYSFKVTVTDFFHESKTFGPITVQVKAQADCDQIAYKAEGYVFFVDAAVAEPGQIRFVLKELEPEGDCRIVKVELIDKEGDAEAALTYPAKFGAPTGCEGGSVTCLLVDVERTEVSNSTFKVRIT